MGTARLQNLLKKKWTEQDVLNMVGKYEQTYLGVAKNDRIRLGGASGGVATAILAFALEHGLIDGALVCRSRVFDGQRVRTEFYIARNLEQLLLSQDSKYVQTRFVPEALRLIDGFDGKLAVVGLPCDLTVLKKRIQRDPQVAAKIVFTIGLFCGHNTQPELIDSIIQKLRPNANSNLTNYRFRIGLWRGYSLARFDEDTVIEKQSAYYNLYQNLYFFCQKKCLYCHDHFAFNADIAIGDIWSYHLKNTNIKYNCLICKNERGSELISSAHDAGYIKLNPATIEEILDGQARGAPTHNNTSAKSQAAARFGMNIPDRHNRKVKWHQYMVAWIIIFNYNWSMNKKYSWLIFKIPRKFLKAYLVLFKGLESLK